MQQGDRVRSLTEKERRDMMLIFEVTEHRKGYMRKIEEQMHVEFDPVLDEVEYECVNCHLKFMGKRIGGHYRNNEECKYMKDRPWLKTLPANWRQDLRNFLEMEGEK